MLGYLFFAGDERFGALGVSVSADAYVARDTGPLPRLADVQALARLVRQIASGEPVDEAQRRLITPGTTLGGARPKALLELDGQPWVLKFSEPGEPIDMPLVEHAAMTLAAHAGIRVALKAAGEPLGYPELAQWKTHFARTGVAAADIDSLAAAIDRPFLRNQRDAYLK